MTQALRSVPIFSIRCRRCYVHAVKSYQHSVKPDFPDDSAVQSTQRSVLSSQAVMGRLSAAFLLELVENPCNRFSVMIVSAVVFPRCMTGDGLKPKGDAS
jgi:hypothetical protein